VLALGDSSELKAIYSEAVLRPRRAAFSDMIRRARGAGTLPDGIDPELIQDMLSGALLHQILLEPADQTEEQLRDYIIRLLTGLGLLQK
jgi:AcrR family transcriptional regulator